MSKFFANI